MNTLKTLYQLTVLSIFSLLAWVMLSYAVTAKAAPPPTESNQSNTKLNTKLNINRASGTRG